MLWWSHLKVLHHILLTSGLLKHTPKGLAMASAILFLLIMCMHDQSPLLCTLHSCLHLVTSLMPTVFTCSTSLSKLIASLPTCFNCKIYPLSRDKQDTEKKFINENLETGYIIPLDSPYSFSTFMVPKKDSKEKRYIINNHPLNVVTRKDVTPLPNLKQYIENLPWIELFSKFDIYWGYNNIHVCEGDQWKAAFKTHKGLFEPKVMFFGMSNSPASFQWFMNSILEELYEHFEKKGILEIWHILQNYMNDCGIETLLKDLKLHIKIIHFLFNLLAWHGLHLKLSKSVFLQLQMDFLGVYISKEGATVNPAKVALAFKKLLGYLCLPWQIVRQRKGTVGDRPQIWFWIKAVSIKFEIQSWSPYLECAQFLKRTMKDLNSSKEDVDANQCSQANLTTDNNVGWWLDHTITCYITLPASLAWSSWEHIWTREYQCCEWSLPLYSAVQSNVVNFFKAVFLFKMHNKHYFSFDKNPKLANPKVRVYKLFTLHLQCRSK